MAQTLKPLAAGTPPEPLPSNDNDPRLDQTLLAVEGMHCGACIQAVEGTLQKVPGVVSARVNLASRRVAVHTRAGTVVPETLIGALSAAGYRSAEMAIGQEAFSETLDSDLTRRLGVAGFAAMNIMLLSVSVWAGASGEMDQSVQTLFHWLSAMIGLPAVAYAGRPFFVSAATALRARRLNMDVPISLGVILASAMSLFQTMRGSEQVYFDAAVTLLAFLLIGRLLDQQMRTRAAGAAANLLGLRPVSATVISHAGKPERVPVAAIVKGMRVLAAAGERIAADGIVREGASDVDESLLTGESATRRVKPGDRVFAGTINVSGPLTLEATAACEATLLAEIGRLMSAAEQGRGRYVRLADRAARYYAPAVHMLGLSTFIAWMIAGQGWEAALTAAIAVLIITCPCALALAVPAVQVAASSRLFSKGIILKAADGLERLSEVDTIVFDKTGTLTLGEPRLVDPLSLADDVMAGAAALAVISRHPYSRAIVAAAADRGLHVTAAKSALEVPGAGIRRAMEQGEERLGSAAWCGADEMSAAGSEIWYRPAGGKPVPFRFSDTIRADAADVVHRLTAAGYGVELLSGDREAAVATAAEDCAISTYRSAAKPQDKIARIEELARAGHKVLMVGDGLNDAPALAAAHASLSPSGAADISQTAADAIFQGSRLEPVIDTLGVAKAVRVLALQNFAIAVGYNIIFVPLAMAGIVTPLIAAVAMSTSSITVTANAIRLKNRRLEF